MEYRELAKKLSDTGYQRTQGKGDHEEWTLGEELVVITQTCEISPGLVRKALQSIARSQNTEGEDER